MFLMKCHMRDVNRWRADIFEFLLKLEEAVLDLFLDIVWQLLLCADQFWILGVPTLLHDSTVGALERFVKLVDTAIGHWYVLVLLDLFGSLWCDTVHRWPGGVHLRSHGRRSLISRLRIVLSVPLSILLILVDRVLLHLLVSRLL